MLSASIREEARKADTDEPSRQDMRQEATQELFSGHRHFALLAAVGVVLPPETDFAVGHIQNPMIGDGDAVGLAGQVLQHMLGPPKGRLAYTI